MGKRKLTWGSLDMATLTTYRPRKASIYAEMDRMMESLLGSSSTARDARYPAVDVVERDGSFGFSVELPGYGKDDVEIKVDNNLLTISAAEMKEVKEEKKEKKESVRYV